jgi:hypothetical protein
MVVNYNQVLKIGEPILFADTSKMFWFLELGAAKHTDYANNFKYLFIFQFRSFSSELVQLLKLTY